MTCTREGYPTFYKPFRQTNVKPPPPHFISNRVLKVNVGFMLSAGAGNYQDSRFDILEPIRVADDLDIHSLVGTLRLTRAKEGVLVQAQVTIEADNECSRCLEVIKQEIFLEIEELYAHPPSSMSEFGVGADAILDLAPLLRAEILIEKSHKVLCREGCLGLCQYCGTNLNHETCNCDRQPIDPRMARLKELLDRD